MSRVLSSQTRDCLTPAGVWVALAVLQVTAVAAEMERAAEPPSVMQSLRGTYEIRREGREVGTETFFHRVLSDNTVVIESTYDVVADDGAFVSGNNRLEYEDDSGFPVSYFTLRRTQSEDNEQVRESTANVYSNVVVWDNRSGDRDERKIIEVPVGCLFVEANIANHVATVVNRYVRSQGGKQGFAAFDPLAGGMAKVAIEHIGEASADSVTTLTVNGPLTHYRYYGGEMSQADVYADSDGLVVRIDVPVHDLHYVLVSIEETGDDTAVSK